MALLNGVDECFFASLDRHFRHGYQAGCIVMLTNLQFMHKVPQEKGLAAQSIYMEQIPGRILPDPLTFKGAGHSAWESHTVMLSLRVFGAFLYSKCLPRELIF